MAESLAALHHHYQALDVEVVRIPSETTDSVFHRDVFAWTPWGLIKCRMGKRSRRKEPRAWFAAMGVSPVLEIREPGTFEGADLLWIGENEVILATGARTNEEGAWQVKNFLRRRDVVVTQVHLPKWHDQHLLGVANWAADRMWSCETAGMPRRFNRWRIPRTEIKRKAANWVNVNGAVVMPANCRITTKWLRAAGITELYTVPIPDLLKHGGGVACASGVLYS